MKGIWFIALRFFNPENSIQSLNQNDYDVEMLSQHKGIVDPHKISRKRIL